jgi:hypothetical protein
MFLDVGGSPARSELGQFIRSRLGVRSRGGYADYYRSFVMVFIDETSVYGSADFEYAEAQYEYAVNQWNAKVERFGPPRFGCVLCQLPRIILDVEVYSRMVPPGYSIPEYINHEQVSRTMTYEEFQTAYENSYVGEEEYPPRVILLIDDSGSMTRENLEPGIDEFEDWMDANGIDYKEQEFFTERWLGRYATPDSFGFVTVETIVSPNDSEWEDWYDPYFWQWFREGFGI